MQTISIKKSYLAAIAFFQAKNDVRFYLNSVAVIRGHIVATDGNILGAIKTGIQDFPTVIIPDHVVDTFLKLSKREKNNTVLLSYDKTANRGELSVGDIKVPFTPVEGVYPAFERVLPYTITEQGKASNFNPELLMMFKKAYKALNRDSDFYLIQNGDQGARVVFPDFPEFIGVIMPKTYRHKALDVLNEKLQNHYSYHTVE